MGFEFELTQKVNLLRVDSLKNIASLAGANVFVETGTYRGETTIQAAKAFAAVYSLELSETLFLEAKEKLAAYNNVSLIQGNSAERLDSLLVGLCGSVVFWLDAHYSEGCTAKGDQNTPIMEELKSIYSSGLDSALILVDDLRCFISDDNIKRASLKGYPKLGEIREFISRFDRKSKVFVVGDILVIGYGIEGIETSELVDVCTISREYDGEGDVEKVISAEEKIANCKSDNENVLLSLAEEYEPSTKYGLGGHYYLWRGLLYERQGRFCEALVDYNLAISLGLCHWRIKWYLARVTFLIGDFEDARVLCNEVLSSQPDYSPALGLLKKCVKNGGNFEA